MQQQKMAAPMPGGAAAGVAAPAPAGGPGEGLPGGAGAPVYAPVPGSGAQDAAAAPAPGYAAPKSEPPPRRVGSTSMGLALIAAGVCVLCAYFVPGFPLVTALKLAPLVLIALGGEMIWRGRRGERVRYDLASLFISLILLGAGLVASLVPLALEYYRPGQYETVRRQAEQQVAACLDGAQVYRAQVYVSLNGQPGLTDEQARRQARVSCEVELYGPFASAEAFAEVCRRQAEALQGLALADLRFFWEGEEQTMSLQVVPTLAVQAQAAQLATRVEVSAVEQPAAEPAPREAAAG